MERTMTEVHDYWKAGYDEGKHIADTTHNQLGGGQFDMMTGARGFAHDKNGTLSFRIGRNPKSITHVRITYNRGKDLYDMEFGKINRKTYEYKVMKKHTDVYADQLRPIFEKETGLYTSLR